MTRSKKRARKSIWVISALLMSMVSFGHAAEIKGVRFADTVIVDQAELNVRGLAVLKWAMLFDVYAGAFYLPEGVLGRSWTNDIPKRLELAYFREIKARDFADSSDQLLRRNLSPEKFQALEDRLKTLYQLFRDVAPGDRYSLTYSSGNGTELRLNDHPLGVITGADFAVAYFGIWLGEKPIRKGFRDKLLGGR